MNRHLPPAHEGFAQSTKVHLPPLQKVGLLHPAKTHWPCLQVVCVQTLRPNASKSLASTKLPHSRRTAWPCSVVSGVLYLILVLCIRCSIKRRIVMCSQCGSLWYNSWTSGSIGFETTFWTTKGKRKRWSTVNIVATDRKLCATNLATVLVAVRNVDCRVAGTTRRHTGNPRILNTDLLLKLQVRRWR
jgi:hypothetical protein